MEWDGRGCDSNSRRGALCVHGEKGALRHHTGLRPETTTLSSPLFLSASVFPHWPLASSTSHLSPLSFSFLAPFYPNFYAPLHPPPLAPLAGLSKSGRKGRPLTLTGAVPKLRWSWGAGGARSHQELPFWASLKGSRRPPRAAAPKGGVRTALVGAEAGARVDAGLLLLQQASCQCWGCGVAGAG